jgi:hypothetical protein
MPSSSNFTDSEQATAAAPIVAPSPTEVPHVKDTVQFEGPRAPNANDGEAKHDPLRVTVSEAAQSFSAAEDSITRLQSASGAVGLGAALSTRVRFAGGAVPLWTVIAPSVILALLVVVFVLIAVSSRPAAVTPAVAVRTPGAVAPLTAPPAALNSDPSASAQLKALEAKPPETLASGELLTLAQARVARDLSAVKKLAEKLGADPNLIKDPVTLRDLQKFSENPDTARDALSVMAALPAPIAADLIYETWTRTTARNELTELARKLVYTPDVRAKASKALAVALDLRAAETCEQNLDAVSRAANDADRRSLHLLTKLKRKQGCGPAKRQDCYPCLREGDGLDKAITVAKARREPAGFRDAAK